MWSNTKIDLFILFLSFVRTLNYLKILPKKLLLKLSEILINLEEIVLFTWIYRIAINTAKNYFSNKSRGAETYNEDVLDGALSDLSLNSDNPETLLAAEEMKDAVNQAFQNLPDEIRSTLSLREYDGLSYEEIAKVQNCPIGTVRSRIFKGRELINETFSKLGLSKTWSN